MGNNVVYLWVNKIDMKKLLILMIMGLFMCCEPRETWYEFDTNAIRDILCY